MDQYRVLGVMSGSSLDGLDLCYAHFILKGKSWSYQILHTATSPLPDTLTRRLRYADQLSALELLKLDITYGKWAGQELQRWVAANQLTPELIGFHGHTVFHEPAEGISLQIGNGPAIAQITNIQVVDAFRIQDVLKGGQGAPLVPVGEHYLMPGFQGFVNLGGIANISVHKKETLAWDVAPCNQVLNYFAAKLGKPYDEGGHLAAGGKLVPTWHEELTSLSYFQQTPPKSLSNQWTQRILDTACPDAEDALATYADFMAMQVADQCLNYLSQGDKVLVTGGGALNNYLIKQLKKHTAGHVKIIVPDPLLISFKEALIFGFLGLLKILDKPNVFKSVTGARSDSVAGTVHRPY